MRGVLAFATLALAGCAATAEEPRVIEPTGECMAGPGQAFIGRKATSETGAELLAATGAKVIRWVPPRTLVTMDFRPDRLTVYYDDDMVIERLACT